MPLYKNVASQKISIYVTDENNDPVTGDAANITAKISLDGAAAASTNDTNPTEIDAGDCPGIYQFDLTQAETNADLIIISPDSSTADVFIEPIEARTIPGDNAALNVNVTELLGTAWLTPGTAGTPDVNVKLISGDSGAADAWESLLDGTEAIDLTEFIRLGSAALGGKSSGLDTGTAIFRNPADTKDVINASCDESGNRNSVTLDLT